MNMVSFGVKSLRRGDFCPSTVQKGIPSIPSVARDDLHSVELMHRSYSLGLRESLACRVIVLYLARVSTSGRHARREQEEATPVPERRGLFS
jgi:hypothetical protein